MRKVVEYRGYKVIASDLNGRPQAQFYRSKPIVTPERFEAETFDAVIQKAKTWIDNNIEQDALNRRAAHIATPEKYAEYLGAEGLKDYERAMLLAHAKAQILTATELAAAAGQPSYSFANSFYGKLGKSMSSALGLETPIRDDGSEIWTMALAGAADDDQVDPDVGHFRWAIHLELVEGMVRAGVIEQEPEWLRQLRDER